MDDKHFDPTDTNLASLISVDWEVFSRQAVIVFATDERTTQLVLRGVHFLGSRQTIHPRGIQELGPHCEVKCCTIENHDVFTDLLLQSKFGFPNTIVIYDSDFRDSSDPGFKHPMHFAMVTDAGALDIVCEELEVIADMWNDLE